MGEIVGKLGAALTGFWWALDEHERRLVLLGGVWACLLGLEVASRNLRARERAWIAGEVLRELEERRAAR